MKDNKWIWGLTVLGAIILFILIPLIINYLYNSDFVIVYTDWGAKEVLSFYGSVLTFLGTVSLGVVTVNLSIKSNEINQKMQELQENDKKERLMEMYYQYVENLSLLYDLYSILGNNLQNSELEIFANIKKYYLKAESIRKRLITLDFDNSNHEFFLYAKHEVENLLKFRNVDDTLSDEFMNSYKNYCIDQSKIYEEKSAEFICDMYNSIYKEDTQNANT